MEPVGDGDKRDVRRPMNAFLIFCKRHRSIVREKNPDLDNRSVTRILGDLWANLSSQEKAVYTDLAKQYKDAFMKANPDYKWHNPEKAATSQKSKPTNAKVMRTEIDYMSEGSIVPGKLADPSNMGGLSLLLMAGEQTRIDLDPKPGSMEVPVSSRVLEHVNQSADITDENNLVPVKEQYLMVTKYLDDHSNLQPGKDVATPFTCENVFGKNPSLENFSKLSSANKLSTGSGHEPVWKIDGKMIENQSQFKREGLINYPHEKRNKRSSSEGDYTLLELAEMCSSQQADVAPNTQCIVGTAIPNIPCRVGTAKNENIPSTKVGNKETYTNSMVDLKNQILNNIIDKGKSQVNHMVTDHKARKSLLAEAFRDTCQKGAYPDILRDNSVGTKITNLIDNHMVQNQEVLLFEQKHNNLDEKENISKLIVADVKDKGDNSEDESTLITCGKLVVNHIIDKLFSSDVATAAKMTSGGQEHDKKDFPESHSQTNYNHDFKTGELSSKLSSSTGELYDEHDGKSCNTIKEVKIEIKQDISNVEVSKLKESLVCSGHNDDKQGIKTDGDDVSKNENISENGDNMKIDEQKADELNVAHEVVDPAECDHEDSEDYHPVRKSRRRNRGQRYQELINEGIIQPSKERMAALQHPETKDEGCEEDFQCIDTYILPETAMRRIRKRTTSESAKDKLVSVDDVKRYKTGDFDLEAHIATLPACPVESMGRKRGFVRQRHYSECTGAYLRKTCEEQPLPVFTLEKTVSLPPHVKLPSPERSQEPVIGSRKRKARKHSITHLLPAPTAAPTNTNNAKPKTEEHVNTEAKRNVKTKQQTADSNHKQAVSITMETRSGHKNTEDKSDAKTATNKDDQDCTHKDTEQSLIENDNSSLITDACNVVNEKLTGSVGGDQNNISSDITSSKREIKCDDDDNDKSDERVLDRSSNDNKMSRLNVNQSSLEMVTGSDIHGLNSDINNIKTENQSSDKKHVISSEPMETSEYVSVEIDVKIIDTGFSAGNDCNLESDGKSENMKNVYLNKSSYNFDTIENFQAEKHLESIDTASKNMAMETNKKYSTMVVSVDPSTYTAVLGEDTAKSQMDMNCNTTLPS